MTAPAYAPRSAASDGPSEFASDPFIRRLADPRVEARRLASIADLRHGLKVLEEQREVACEADAMYEGDVGVAFASQGVRKLLAKNGGVEDIPDFNYARIPVDTIANRLQIAAVKVAPEETEDDDGEDLDEAAKAASKKLVKRAERAIKKLRKVNQLDSEEKGLHKDVSRHGDAYLFVWPVKNAAGKIVSVDMRVNNAHTVAFIYDDEDPLRVLYVIKSWTVEVGDDGSGDTPGTYPVIRANLYYPGDVSRGTDEDDEDDEDGGDREAVDDVEGPDGPVRAGTASTRRRRGEQGRIERWVTKQGANPDRIEAWARVHADDADIDDEDIDQVAADEFGDEDDPLDADDIPSPYGLTWFHFRNDRPGHPEHKNAYGPQTLINKLIVAHAATIDYQSFPQRYLLADPKVDDPLQNVIDPDHPEDEEDDPENETGTSGLRADPAVVWRLWGKSVGEFQASDPSQFLEPLDRYIKAMAELTDTPQHAFSKASADMPSGEAVRGLDGPMLVKVEDRQKRYDPTWEDAYELALMMLGITGVEVDVRWVPAAAVNDLNGLQVLQAKVALGLPAEIALNEAGYPTEQIEEWLKDAEGGSVGTRLDLLVKLGGAAQTLAAGVTAGIVDAAATQAFISRLVRLIAEGSEDPKVTGPNALPKPEYRDPPPTNPAEAAVAAQAKDPLTQAKVEHTKAQVESTKASADAARAGAEALRSGVGKNGQPAKKAAGSTTAQAQNARG